MPYTNEKTSNTIEGKNTIKSRTYFHFGPHHKTLRQDKTLMECVIINKNVISFFFGTYQNETCIDPLDQKMLVGVRVLLHP